MKLPKEVESEPISLRDFVEPEMHKLFLALMLTVLTNVAIADDASGPNGFWLKKGLSACPKVFSKGQLLKTATQIDTVNCLAVSPWVMGYIAAQWQNNAIVDYTRSVLQRSIQAAKANNDQSAVNEFKRAIAIQEALVPLDGLPTSLPPEQATAVILKYLDNHPEKWGASAVEIVQTALRDAFLTTDKN